MPELVSINVMNYNEAATLADTVRELASIELHGDFTREIVIIDDGSSDDSLNICSDLENQFGFVRTVRHESNRGLGGVYRTGFKESHGEWITFFPADGQFPANILSEFLEHTKDVDMVLGYLPQRSGSMLSKVLSRVERILYYCLLGRMPRFQGVMLFRRRLLDAIPLVSSGRGWAIVMEFIMKAYRFDVPMVSVPTTIRARRHGSSKVNNVRNVYANFLQLIHLRRVLR